ncbi:hypothetical protein [Ruegeria hyattellae]|uniref:hypothetical protein n=1 Tax=Ruegeria hyattellae TaxID=3233337 RepID=UPI00355C78D1
MPNEAELNQSSTTSELKNDGSTGSEPIDPVLENIRSAIDLNTARAVGSSAGPAQAEEVVPEFEEQAQQIRQIVLKTLPVRRAHQLVRSFLKRPDATRILSVLLLLVLLVLQPGVVVFLFLIAVLIGFVLYFSFGPDRAQDWVRNRYLGLRERDPDGAERIRRRAAVASKKLSEIVEKLPERWTAGLYLPDFEEPEELPEKFKTDPFERLANQQN